MHLAFAAPVLLAVVGAQQPTLLVTGATPNMPLNLFALSGATQVSAKYCTNAALAANA